MKKLLVLFFVLAAAVTACFSCFTVSGASDDGRISIESAVMKIRYASYTHAGTPVLPDRRNGSDEITVTLNGRKLVKNTDYTLIYRDNNRPGIATVRAVGRGRYKGEVTGTFIVKPRLAEITGTETGKGNILVSWKALAGADGYQVLYSKDKSFSSYHSTTVMADTGKTSVNLKNIPEPGEKYYIKVRGFIIVNGSRYGAYCSPREKVVKGGIGKITIPTLNYVYRGRDLRPTVTVRDTDGNKLTYGTDYTYTISNACNVGTATISVAGKGNYTGTGTKKFNITPTLIANCTVSGLDESYSIGGGTVRPEPVLRFNSAVLVSGRDYTLSYKNNDKVGTGTLTVTGKGNFEGSFSRSFEIVKSGIVKKNGAGYYYDKNGVMQTGWQLIDGGYYCFDRITGKLYTDTRVNKIKVDSTGRAVDLTDYQKRRIETFMRAHKIVQQQTSPSDTLEEKRYKLFVWEYSNHPYRVWRLIKDIYLTTDEWDVTYANDIFQKGCGCCVSDSCALAYLYIELGYTDIWVCHDGRHGWVNMGGRIYDPLLAETGYFDPNYNSTIYAGRDNPVGGIRIDA